MIIDCQVHVYERNSPDRPWTSHLAGPPEVTGDQMIAAMDSVGVDAAIIVSVWSYYRYDPSYAVSVRDACPDRFALVAPVDPTDPAGAEIIADLAETKGAVGIRLFELPEDPRDPGLRRTVEAAQRHSIVVNLLAHEKLESADAIVAAYPDCQFALDHLGMRPAPAPPIHPNPFADLEKVAALARHDNLAIKLSGVGSMSADAYPFSDVWDPVLRLVDAFGVDRCMWGSDWTRALDFLSYRESVDMFRLNQAFSAGDRAALMGGALQRIYGWQPSGCAA